MTPVPKERGTIHVVTKAARLEVVTAASGVSGEKAQIRRLR